MSCKGLVELIVLNIGLQAGILDTRSFSMFVIMALILTIITTPLTLWIYPEQFRTTISSVVGNKPRARKGTTDEGALPYGSEEKLKTIFTVVLSKIEHLPALMTFVQILQPPASPQSIDSTTSADDKESKDKRAVNRISTTGTPYVSIDALRLIELTDRTSVVMQSSEANDLLRRDALINVFRTFSHLNTIPVTTALSIVREESFATSVAARARDTDSDLVIIPWSSRSSGIEDGATPAASSTANPFDSLFGRGSGTDKASSTVYTQFVRRVFIESTSDVALFIDRGVSALDSNQNAGQHIFLPFFGGPDDRLALRLAVQLCMHPSVTATVIRIRKTETNDDIKPVVSNETEDLKTEGALASLAANLTVHSTSGAFPDTIYPAHTTQTRMASQAADDLAWEHFVRPAANVHTPAIQAALARITFREESSPTPLHLITEITEAEVKTATSHGKSLLVVVGRARRMAVESHTDELRELAGEHHLSSGDLTKTVGPVATALIPTSSQAMLVVQEANYSPS
jgi:hypothetical protein